MTTGRTFLLADDNLTRELAYVALSRGASRNDIYLAVDDTRAADRHRPEAVPDPDEAVRSAIRRSGTKTMALDEEPHPAPTPLAAPPPIRVAADLRGQLTYLERQLEQAHQRRDDAQHGIESLPRLRRSDRRKLRDKHTLGVDRATADIENLTQSIAEKRSHLRRVEHSIDRELSYPAGPSIDAKVAEVIRRLDELERPEPGRAAQRGVNDDIGLGL